MALSCNAFADNTVGSTQQLVACAAPHVGNLIDHQLLDEQFLLLVLDSLRRMGSGIAIENIQPCDAADALRNASCAMLTNTPAYSLTTPQLQSLILTILNEAICGG